MWLAWLGALAAVTAGMLAVRSSLDKAHVALAYLLLVLGASSRAGRALGLTLSVLAFLCLNFFFVPPYHTLVVGDRLDWLVLGAFLVTSAVAAQLLARARGEASEARRRASEIDRLSAVGAEALNAGRAEEALVAIAEVIRTTLDVERCEIYLRTASRDGVVLAAASTTPQPAPRSGGGRGGRGEDESGTRELGLPSGARLVEWVAGSGQAAVQRADGTMRVGEAQPRAGERIGIDLSGVRTLLLPLRVRDRTVGVLRVTSEGVLRLDAPQHRFLEALSYYAALGVERVRLVAEAEHADALRRADELKNALLASVSHDLRTPLTTIKALAHDIGAEGDERAVIIEEEADRLNRFVADLLDLSRLAGGALAVNPQLTAAEDLVGAALQRVSGALNGRALDVSLDPAEPLLLGRFDFVHSLRILVNLIENALKYSPPDSAVELRVRRAGDALEFVVADRGAGVPTAERERIFEPFYRPAGGPPDAGGAGLGLSIARGLAEAQGGTIRYEPRDGGGSLFALRLPASDITQIADGAADESL